jgi:hypothetical protein
MFIKLLVFPEKSILGKSTKSLSKKMLKLEIEIGDTYYPRRLDGFIEDLFLG